MGNGTDDIPGYAGWVTPAEWEVPANLKRVTPPGAYPDLGEPIPPVAPLSGESNTIEVSADDLEAFRLAHAE